MNKHFTAIETTVLEINWIIGLFSPYIFSFFSKLCMAHLSFYLRPLAGDLCYLYPNQEHSGGDVWKTEWSLMSHIFNDWQNFAQSLLDTLWMLFLLPFPLGWVPWETLTLCYGLAHLHQVYYKEYKEQHENFPQTISPPEQPKTSNDVKMLQPIQTELTYHKQTSERGQLPSSQDKGGGVKPTSRRKESNPKECFPVVHSAMSTRGIVSSAAHSSCHDILPPIRTNIIETGELGLKPWKRRALKSFSQVSLKVISLNNTCRQCVNEILKPCPWGAYKSSEDTLSSDKNDSSSSLMFIPYMLPLMGLCGMDQY